MCSRHSLPGGVEEAHVAEAARALSTLRPRGTNESEELSLCVSELRFRVVTVANSPSSCLNLPVVWRRRKELTDCLLPLAAEGVTSRHECSCQAGSSDFH